jgi:hypothetical protein
MPVPLGGDVARVRVRGLDPAKSATGDRKSRPLAPMMHLDLKLPLGHEDD